MIMTPTFEKPRAEHDRDALAAAIHAAAVAAGIINADQTTTGPQLLMLLQDLTALATNKQATKVVIDFRETWVRNIASDRPIEVVIVDFETNGCDDDQLVAIGDEFAQIHRIPSAVNSSRVGEIEALLQSTSVPQPLAIDQHPQP